MVTQDLIDNAIYDHLSGDASLVSELGAARIYSDAAPPGVSLPYVIFRVQAGGPTNETSRDAADVLIAVMAVAVTSIKANTLAKLISERLHNAEITVGSGWHDFRSQEVGIVQYTEYVESKLYWRRGGTYRLRTAKTSV